jgi:hypothetical protein
MGAQREGQATTAAARREPTTILKETPMRTTKLMFLLSVAALPAIGCGNEGVDGVATESSALLNGQPTEARPEVAMFSSPTGTTCSATMISQKTFVTSANCINYASQTTGGSLTVHTVGTFNVERTLSQGVGSTADDFAYGRITGVAPVSPAALASTEPGAGWLTAMGFGCTTSFCGAPGGKNYVQYWYNGSTPSDINQTGDQGGPVFQGLLTDNGPLVRIAGGTVLTNSGITDYGASVPHYRAWITAMDTAFNADGISYRASVQNNGWMPAVQNGNQAGTTGQSLRLEGLQVWSPRSGVNVCTTAYVQNVGWQPEVCNGTLAGTVGQSLRMEAIKIRLASKPAGTNGVRYNTYLQGIGWQGWMQDGVMAGTTGQSRRIEAIEIALY